MSKKQSMLNPSKTNYKKGMLISSIRLYWRRSKSEQEKLSLGSKFVTNWNEYCVPYPIIVCAEALFRVWLPEMLQRHTTLNICMYIHKYMYINKAKSRERERESEKRAREKERKKERDRQRDRERGRQRE